MRWAVWVATGGGIGYFPRIPGTIGSLAGLILFIPLRRLPPPAYLLFLVFSFFVGVYTATASEPAFEKKDASEIVIDEIHAMLLLLFLLPPSPAWWVAGFFAFRLFDITKPPPIRRLERLPRGWGVMTDDLLAALYAAALLRSAERFIVFGGGYG